MLAMFEVVDNTGSTVSEQEINSHTLIGFGFIACVLAAIWLIRRSKA